MLLSLRSDVPAAAQLASGHKWVEISELQFLGEYASRKVFAKGMESRGGGEVGCGASQFGRFQTSDSQGNSARRRTCKT